MSNFLSKYIFSFFILTSLVLPFSFVSAQNIQVSQIFMFGREDCHFCQDEKAFLEELKKEKNFKLTYFDVYTDEGKRVFDKVTDINNLPKVAPLTFVGGQVIQGFAGKTTQDEIKFLLNVKGQEKFDLNFYINGDHKNISVSNATCEASENGVEICVADVPDEKIAVPFLGDINPKTVSLFTLSMVLGFIDGFNPCAMWVLLTFLFVLLKVGDKKRMIQVAGLFILAETVMYYLILNFWFYTFDFIGLDKIITPIIALVAIVGGGFFVKKFFKNKDKLVCDVGSDEKKKGIEEGVMSVASAPLTIFSALAIIAMAFSVNIIEFACSVGIPQTFTKVLDLNSLSGFSEQFYIIIYTIFYMADDLVVFALAVWGFQKFYEVGHKYSRWSTLVGGILMVILGLIMLIKPSFLTF